MIRPPQMILVLCTTALLGACGPASLTFRNNSQNANSGLSCPGGGSATTAINGLSGSLYYLPAGSANFNSVNDYINPIYLDPQAVFLNNLNVPTRLNTEGFPNLAGGVLTNTSGVNLVTNFALNMQSTVVLTPNEGAGDYQFGILSDDGAILESIDSNGVTQDLVNNDGLHPTLFGCSNQVVHFGISTQLNINVKYYQGPANEIALVLLWRKIPTGTTPNNLYCGDSGNTTFFDPTTSKPQAEYNSMLALGWSPLTTQNFIMPQSSSTTCN
jgi:hypothetical protein